MKKILAMLLAVMMLLSVASVAMADGDTDTPTTPTDDMATVTIKKEYKLANADTTSPTETFTLAQVGDGRVTDGEASSAPALGAITGANFTEGAATVDGTIGEITVALPSYDKVGVYEYMLEEVKPTTPTAGVTYYARQIKLVVTVVNSGNGKLRIAAVHTEAVGGNKSDTFVNTYSAGTLKVSKTVTGNLGDKDKYFEFKVTLTGETGKTYGETYTVTGGSNTANPATITIGEETTFLLKHDETITIANLPYGVTYTVTETAVDGYTTTQTNDNGTISSAEVISTFTNKKDGTIDMGVMLDSMPYVLVLAVVGAAVIALIAKKRRAED